MNLGPDLVSLVEEQAEVGEDDPELLPAVAVLELPQQVTRELVLFAGTERGQEDQPSSLKT